MAHHTRRRFLKVSGAVLGGIAAGTTVTAAESRDRFIVDAKKRGKLDRSDLTVVHDLEPVGLAVVEGSKSAAKRAGKAVPDLELRRNPPSPSDDVPTISEDDASARDEPLYPLQWDKQVQDIPAVHDITRGEGTRVAIIDSGVAAGHPDLQHAVNEDLSRNFSGDDFGAGIPAGGFHGTNVAGIVAANDDNEAGVVGSAPETELVDCRVFPAKNENVEEGGASFGNILAAIVYATEIDSDAANLSLGAYGPRSSFGEKSFGRFYGKMLNSTLTYANRNGTLLSIAAGNKGADLQHDKKMISLPNEGAQAMSVSATGPVGFNHGAPGLKEPPRSPAFYSNYGTNAIDIAAPGGDYNPAQPPGWYYDLVLNCIAIPVFTYDSDGNPVEYKGATYNYSWVAGTSQATPQVSGAAALVKSVNPGYNANQVESTLERTASVPDGYDKAHYGAGFIDPLDAVRSANGGNGHEKY